MNSVAVAVALAGWLVVLSAHADTVSMVERQAFISAVTEKALAGNFESLDKQAEALRVSKARFRDGRWQLAAVLRGVGIAEEKNAKDESAWPEHERSLRRFAEQHHDSTNAWLFYVEALETKAWQVRGPGFNSTTTPEGRAGYRSFIALARAVMDSHKDQLAANPAWYSIRVRVAMEDGEDGDAIRAFFEEGAAREPRYIGIYFEFLYALTPKWGGSTESMVAFINDSARYATPDEGIPMVAWLLNEADGIGEKAVVDSPDIDWGLVRKSMDDVLRLYPDDRNAQAFLWQACIKPDMDLARHIAPLIREATSPYFRGNTRSFEMCKALALGKGPPFYLIDKTRGKQKELE